MTISQETINKLNKFLPLEKLAQLPEVIDKFKIDNIYRLIHFISQTAHESGHFKFGEENLNYSVNNLMSIFGDYFPTSEKALEFAHNPEKIANHVYANRLGNGNEASGDGWLYRGRGDIQITGKYNYQKLKEFLSVDVVKDPDLISSKYSLSSAAFFFTQREIWPICDNGVSQKTIEIVTKKINPKEIGLLDRTNLCIEVYNIVK